MKRMSMHRSTLTGKRPTCRQCGSLLVQFALLLIVLVAILGVVDIGYMYYVKRDLQRIADIAALHAARSLSDDESACQDAGWVSVHANWPAPVAIDSENSKVICGHWEPIPGNRSLNDSGPINAAHVVLKGKAPKLLPGNWSRTVFAEAIAKNDVSVSAFQIGSQLLRFDNAAPLGRILAGLGLNLDDLRILDSDGLAKAKITPAGLLKALNLNISADEISVLTPEGLANIENISILQLINASVSLVQDDTVATSLDILKQRLANIKVGTIKLMDVKIPLARTENQKGIFAFAGIGRDAISDSNASIGSALNVGIGVGEILKTALAVGTSVHAVQVPELNLLGVIKASLTIVEPPTIAIGPIGTIAYASQVRLNVNIDTDQILSGVQGLSNVVQGILKTLGVRINLPIAIDIVAAKGKLEDVKCIGDEKTIDLLVTSTLLNTCVGKIDSANLISSTQSCDIGLAETELIKLLHIPVLSGKLHVPALPAEEYVRGMVVDRTYLTDTYDLSKLGANVERIVDGVLGLLNGLFRAPRIEAGWDWSGSYTGPDNEIKEAVNLYLSQIDMGISSLEARTKKVIDAMLNGVKSNDPEKSLPPLLNSNFNFPNAVATVCRDDGLIKYACPSSEWSTGSFSEALTSYSNKFPEFGQVLYFDNGYKSCRASLDWNECFKFNLIKILNDHPNYVGVLSNNGDYVPSCSGVICVMLKPLLEFLRPSLNALGGILSNLLTDGLGIQLGRTDVRALNIGCNAAQLVY